MTHATYDSYKESGIPWLGKVPAGWEVRKFANFYSARMGQTILGKDVEESGKIPVLSATEQEIIFGYIEKADVVLQPNDLVIPARGNSIGHVKLVKFPCTSTQTTILCRQIQNMNPAFVQYYLLGLRKVLFYFDRTAIPQITVDQVKTNPVLVPPITEQKAIAEFLDTKTAQIDALIAKKKNLLKLLAEQRTALITNAVTRGLDKSAPMKESGITWLGKVPNHWEVKKIAWFFSASKGKDAQIYTKDFCGQNLGEYPVYSGQTENDGIMGLVDHFVYDFGEEGCIFTTTVGAKAMHVSHLKNKFCLSQNCMIICPTTDSVDVRYSYYNFQALFRYERGLIPEYMQASFRMEDLYTYKFSIPPLAEQKAIADFLDCKTAEIDATKDRITTAIDTLKEYRTALITNAVTGKIKVV